MGRLALLLLLASCAFAQLGNVAAVGVSYKPGDSTPVAGTALYARAVAEKTGTYAFTVFDALPATYSPFTVTTNVSVGVAQKVMQMGAVTFYVPTAAGISWTGANTGWNWNAGGLAKIPVYRSVSIMPNVRFVKSSISNSGFQVIGGLLVGWGW